MRRFPPLENVPRNDLESAGLTLPKNLVGKWAGNLQLDPAIFEQLGIPYPPNARQAQIPFEFHCASNYTVRLALGKW